jgi:hypothetical protein
MSFFFASFVVLMRHSIENALYLVFLLALALGLSFVEDWFKALHRSPILIGGAHYASVFLFLIDLTAWGLLVSIGLYRVFVRLIKGDEENEDQVPV